MCLCDSECMSAYFLTSALKEAVGVLLYLHALPFLNLWIPPWLHFCWKEQEGYHHLACVNSRSAVELWPCNSYWHTFHWPLMSPGSASACLMCPVWQRVNVCVCVCGYHVKEVANQLCKQESLQIKCFSLLIDWLAKVNWKLTYKYYC